MPEVAQIIVLQQQPENAQQFAFQQKVSLTGIFSGTVHNGFKCVLHLVVAGMFCSDREADVAS